MNAKNYNDLTQDTHTKVFLLNFQLTVKPVLIDHSKIDKMKDLKAGGSLMKVESTADCSPLEHSAILLTCIKPPPVYKPIFVFF